MYEPYGLGATNIGTCSNPFLCPTAKPSVGPNYYDAFKPVPKPALAPAPAPAPVPKPVITALPVKLSTAMPVLKGLTTTATPAANDSGGVAGGGQTTVSPFPMIEARATGGGIMQPLAPTSGAGMDVSADAGAASPSWLWLALAGGAFLMLQSSKRKR
jgi:hypothetical protein